MDSTPAPGNTLSIPSIVAFALISFFAIRYFFFAPPSPSSGSGSPSSSTSGARRTIPADRIEQVSVMFPQLSRRDIEWDLSRNGASVQATTERVLREGRLPAAPPNFRPSSPPPTTTQPTTANTSPSSTSTSAQQAQQKSTHPDLITRYNLSSRIGKEEPDVAQVKGRQAWSQSKSERETLLKKRREEMVLEARRKMAARESGKGKVRAV